MKHWCLFIGLFLTYVTSYAEPPKEGMWLPQLLGQLNYPEMEAMGLTLTPEQIFSAQNSSLKDAIVSFGGFCTGSLISDKGLLLTNHHCGYGEIQQHSSVENNYLRDGFWASTLTNELPNPGLTATFIVDIKEVTNQILLDISDTLPEAIRLQKIRLKAAEIEKSTTEGTHYGAKVKSFFAGNSYYLFITETFEDVRLVGAPPSAIGKFGGDTDNWIWPRHTGDFSLFRIYADSNNHPAPYHPNNQPYKPKHFLPVSLDGVSPGDFTMVFGFPGSTDEYAPSFSVQETMEETFPTRIRLREIRLQVIDRYMASNEAYYIQYASKQSRIANGYKKWQGAIRGLARLNAIQVKKEQEQAFQVWADTAVDGMYASLLPAYANVYSDYHEMNKVREYLSEALFGIEGLSFAWRFDGLVKASEANNIPALETEIQSLQTRIDAFFKNYHKPIDREIAPQLLDAFIEGIAIPYQGDAIKEIDRKWKGDFDKYANYLFNKSILLNEDKVRALLANYQPKDYKKIVKDPAYRLISNSIEHYLANGRNSLAAAAAAIDSLDRLYLEALMQWQPDKTFYPDANSTLRLTYGLVDDYAPKDGVTYTHQTTLAGIMEKAKQDRPDYVLLDKLAALYATKDYGPYGNGDTMPVCFIASNHTSGGNSGSPVINGKGELIGLNFDRNWEGTMSDIMYDPNQVRNISVDIRYVMLVIDKVAGAHRIIEEINFQ